MKIGIYGDSFGDDNGQWPHRHNDVGPGWTQLLGMTGTNQISNYVTQQFRTNVTPDR